MPNRHIVIKKRSTPLIRQQTEQTDNEMTAMWRFGIVIFPPFPCRAFPLVPTDKYGRSYLSMDCRTATSLLKSVAHPLSANKLSKPTTK
jgi:hypothetical protein